MHPMMIMAVAGEVERERQRDRRLAQRQSRALALATCAEGFGSSDAARGFARRRLAGISLRPRVF